MSDWPSDTPSATNRVFAFLVGTTIFFLPATLIFRAAEPYGAYALGPTLYHYFLPHTAEALSLVPFCYGIDIFLVIISLLGLAVFRNPIPFISLSVGAFVGIALAIALDRWIVHIVVGEYGTPMPHGASRFCMGLSGSVIFVVVALRFWFYAANR